MSFAERAANSIKTTSIKFYGELVSKPLPLDVHATVGLNVSEQEGKNVITIARRLDEQGDWVGSAGEYYTAWKNSTEPSTRIAGVIGLSQELINMKKYRQAREVLHQGHYLRENENTHDGNYLRAATAEKLGWIELYEGNYQEAGYLFNRARDIITVVPRGEWERREIETYLSSIHFLGRVNLSANNFTAAINNFSLHIQETNQFENIKETRPAVLAFSYGWLVRSFLARNAEGDLGRAKEAAAYAREFFEKEVEITGNQQTFAHQYMIEGAIAQTEGEFTRARDLFREALTLRLNAAQPYKKGVADAYLGIAATYYGENNISEAIKTGFLAIKSYMS